MSAVMKLFSPVGILLATLALAWPALAGQDDKGVGRSASPASTLSAYRKIHVLAVGVGGYRKPELRLKYTANDANGFADVMRDLYGVPESSIQRLIDPTKQELSEALYALADPSRVGPADAVIVFISSHGVEIVQNSLTFGWILPADADVNLTERNPAVLNQRAVAMTAVWDALNPSPARHIMLFADACVTGSLIANKGDGLSPVFSENYQRMGREAMVAAGRGETAREDSVLRNGVFTKALLEELKAKAAAGHPFLIDAIFPRVRETASRPNLMPEYGPHPYSAGGRLMLTPLRRPPAPQDSPPPSNPSPTPAASAQQLFDQGMALYQKENYLEARKLFEQAAVLGSGSAMFYLGYLHYKGLGSPADLVFARIWFEKGASAGYGRSFAFLGRMHQDGLGVPQSYAKAKEWYERGAALSDSNSIHNLGSLHREGNGVPRDYAKARELFERAAALGSGMALSSLGQIHADGLGVPQSYAKAKELYEKGAALSDTSSIISLGYLYQMGNGVPRDYAKARELFERAAALGSGMALSSLGQIHATGLGVPRNYAKAKEWYEKGAAKSDGVSINNLGDLYRSGKGVPRDYARAKKLFEKAAALGVAASMAQLGGMYERGEGAPQSYAKAKEWYEKGAAHSDSVSINNLGSLYYSGHGVPRSYAKAKALFERAAALGQATSMYNLGVMYEKGQGVTKSITKAKEWYKKAADLGEKEAQASLKRLGG